MLVGLGWGLGVDWRRGWPSLPPASRSIIHTQPPQAHLPAFARAVPATAWKALWLLAWPILDPSSLHPPPFLPPPLSPPLSLPCLPWPSTPDYWCGTGLGWICHCYDKMMHQRICWRPPLPTGSVLPAETALAAGEYAAEVAGKAVLGFPDDGFSSALEMEAAPSSPLGRGPGSGWGLLGLLPSRAWEASHSWEQGLGPEMFPRRSCNYG